MSGPKILIIGCGIAGPVLAILLKRKGYNPVVFEKVRTLGDAGASLMLMPNGMKVLNLVGLTQDLYSGAWPLSAYQDLKDDGTVLGGSSLPASYQQKYGQSAMGVSRTRLNLMMKDLLLQSNIEVHEGWSLQSTEEDTTSVQATFTNGEVVQGAFLIGADGIKAVTRTILLNKHNIIQPPPTYTGLSQTAGFSPMPEAFASTPSTLRNRYGNAAHVIAYPVSPTKLSWAVTLPSTEAEKESWGLCNSEERILVKKDLSNRLQNFEPTVHEIISSAERIIKFGLFDREELAAPQWYTNRIVLCGDAAHPTSPHLGQGANQALEDCYHLANVFPDLNGEDSGVVEESLSGGGLGDRFAEYANRRQPRTAALVRGARAVGDKRVVTSGKADCEARDARVVEEWRDVEGVAARFDGLLREPF